jgi:hypothetical protein
MEMNFEELFERNPGRRGEDIITLLCMSATKENCVKTKPILMLVAADILIHFLLRMISRKVVIYRH